MSAATMTQPNGPSPAPEMFSGEATSGSGGSYELCPAGNYAAHLVAIYDLGTHDGEYQGEAKPDQRSLYFAWEIHGVKRPDGKPFVIGKDYTVYVNDSGRFEFGKKNGVRKMLEGWRGKAYGEKEVVNPGACLGRPCLFNVVHSESKGKTYHNLGSISKIPDGMPVPPQTIESVAYLISMGEPPVHLWLPYIWYRPGSRMEPLDKIASYSKERTGQPIGKPGKPADTDYSEAVPAAGPARGDAYEGPDDDKPPF